MNSAVLILLVFVVSALLALVAFSFGVARKIERHFPPAGKFIQLGEERIHYTDQGQGPVVLMVHGLLGNMHNFHHKMTARLLPDHRVIVIDRPGCGYSRRGKNSDASVFTQARTIAEFIRTLELEQPMLVGHSLGGAIGLALAIEHPELVRQLLLLGPLTATEQRPPKIFEPLEIRQPWLRRIISVTLAIPISMKNKAMNMREVFAPDPVPEDFASKGGGLLTIRPCAFFGASSDLVAVESDMHKLVPRYAELTTPVAVIYGEQDNILSYSRHGQGFVEKVPQAKLVGLPGRGHMITSTSPEPICAVIKQLAKLNDEQPNKKESA